MLFQSTLQSKHGLLGEGTAVTLYEGRDVGLGFAPLISDGVQPSSLPPSLSYSSGLCS